MTESLRGSRLNGADYLTVVGVSLIILSTILIQKGVTSSEDLEETVVPALLTLRSLFSGGTGFWTGSLGIGLPLNFTTRTVGTPFSLIFLIAPFAGTSIFVFVAHVFIAKIAILRCFSLVGVNGWLRRVFLLIYSLTYIEVLLTTFPFLTHLPMVTMTPVLIWIAIRTSQSRTVSDAVFFSGLFSLIFAYIASASLLSMSLPVLSVVALFALAVCSNRLQNFVAICVAMALAVLMNSVVVYTFLSEAMHFPDWVAGMRQSRSEDMPSWVGYMMQQLFVLPFIRPSGTELLSAFHDGGVANIFKMAFGKIFIWREHFNWGVVIGHPILMLAFASPFLRYNAPFRFGLSAAFLGGMFVSLFVPTEAFFSVAGSMGDFAMASVVFGLLLVAPHLAAIERARRPGSRAFLVTTLALTVGSLLVVQAPNFRDVYHLYTDLEWKGTAERDFVFTEFRNWMDERFPSKGRLYITQKSEFTLQYQAYLSANALALVGYDLVTGSAKGIVLDDLYAISPRSPSSTIYGVGPNIRNKDFLDILGISIVAAMKDEAVHPDLEWKGDFRTQQGELVSFYHNPTAWPKAFSVNGFAGLIPARRPECPDDRLLCADFGVLRRAKAGAAVSINRDIDDIVVTVPKSPQEQYVVISEYYRPGWQRASKSDPVSIAPVFGSLIGLTIPPGVELARITYRPFWLVVSTWLAVATTLTVMLGCGVAWAARRHRAKDVES